jgi:plastocyanin
MKFLPLLLGSTLVVAMSAHADTGVPAAAAPHQNVAIQKFAFAPKEITITAGTTLVWTNHDETPHTIIASDGSFVSKAMDTDDRYEHTFATAGDYTYFCTLHPYMTGTIHVRAAAAGR